MPQLTIKLYAIGRIDPVSENDANKYIKFYFFADLPLRILGILTTEDTSLMSTILPGMSTNVKDACFFSTPEEVSFVLLEPFLLVGGFGATNLLMVSFLEVRLAGGRPSTSKVLFLDGKAGLSARGVSVKAI